MLQANGSSRPIGGLVTAQQVLGDLGKDAQQVLGDLDKETSFVAFDADLIFCYDWLRA